MLLASLCNRMFLVFDCSLVAYGFCWFASFLKISALCWYQEVFPEFGDGWYLYCGGCKLIFFSHIELLMCSFVPLFICFSTSRELICLMSISCVMSAKVVSVLRVIAGVISGVLRIVFRFLLWILCSQIFVADALLSKIRGYSAKVRGPSSQRVNHEILIGSNTFCKWNKYSESEYLKQKVSNRESLFWVP